MKNLGRKLTLFSVNRGRTVTVLMLALAAITVSLALAPTLAPQTFPSLNGVAVDTDPENMLPADEPARVYHHAVKAEFGLHDGVVLGIVNDVHPQGVFNVATLAHVHDLTALAKTLPGVVPTEVLSIATVDNMRNEGTGTLRFDWLMSAPPTDEATAQGIGVDALRIPFINGSLVSGDGKVATIFVPLTDKHHASTVALALEERIATYGLNSEGTGESTTPTTANGDAFHIAGLPIAEEVFGHEMFIQMAVSAPLAMLVIFVLMLLFFKRLNLVIAPMIIAMVASLVTMGLLVISGNTIHIMSSMIPIFIMPIAVLDSIHILSDFFEHYQQIGDRKKTMVFVMKDLSSPMFFTSLTTAAGFGSLALTPIPPVQAFGIFVAVGVLLAWFLTITFIPAWIGMMSPKTLKSFGRPKTEEAHESGFFGRVNNLTYRRARWVLLGSVALIGLATYGISLIQINDNPVRWFEYDHRIRVADRELNAHFEGTHEVYLTVRATEQPYGATTYGTQLVTQAQARKKAVKTVFSQVSSIIDGLPAEDAETRLDALDRQVRSARKIAPEAEVAAWGIASQFVDAQFDALDAADTPEGATTKAALHQAATTFVAKAQSEFDGLAARIQQLQNQSPAPTDAAAFREALKDGEHTLATTFANDAAQFDQAFKDPEVLRWLDALATGAVNMPGVGKANALPTLVKTVHRDLVSGTAADFRIPNQRAMVAQTLEQMTMSHRRGDLWHFVTPDYRNTILWLQLDSADNRVMEALLTSMETWLADNPPPAGIDMPTWSGLTYINSVWQDKMVLGMTDAFIGSFIIVLLMMILLFRSVLWGLLSMVPLLITVGFTYGMLGLLGKDYDMPVAVLSALSLGLAVDYSIHFLARARSLQKEHGSWEIARHHIFAEPARAISRNVIVLGVGFLPLLLAPLVPYQTVGVLIATLLLLAGGATLIILPALIAVMQPLLFRNSPTSQGDSK